MRVIDSPCNQRRTIQYPRLIFGIYCVISISIINFVAPQPSNTACILSVGMYNSSCEGGYCNGSLNQNCCPRAFHGYLHALARRANQTGQIFLDSTEQRKCLTGFKNKEMNIINCGIEKLTRGARGCGNFSVDQVFSRLGDQVRKLWENCELVKLVGELDVPCNSCRKGWQDIKPMPGAESENCRFAILLALTSTRIEDDPWVQNIYECLVEESSDRVYIVNQPDRLKLTSLPLQILKLKIILTKLLKILKRKSKRKKSIGKGFYAAFGASGALVAVAISVWMLVKRCRKLKALPKINEVTLSLPKELGNLKVPIKEVYSATNNLNNMNFIGEGTAGKVYKGTLLNNQNVAVKHITSDGCPETFLREVRSLLHVRHPNLVALLGYCENKAECFLVYELCPNGNLSEWLFGQNKVLSWIQRLQIAIDSAQGLLFLHVYPDGCIVHRDVKPTNILLGTNFEAKLSDFGLSKVINIGESYMSSEVRGTFGYLDPEYQDNRRVNSAADVYSFGMVVLQILSGRKVINMSMNKPVPLDKMAKSVTRSGSIVEFVDPKLDGEYSEEAFDLTFKLAVSCTGLKQERPSMKQVVLTLEEALKISTKEIVCTPKTTPDWSCTPKKRTCN